MMDTDAAYRVVSTDLSRILGHYYFTNHSIDYSKGIPTKNNLTLKECKTPKTVVSPFSEAETCGTFENKQNVIQLWHIIETIYLHQQLTKGLLITTYILTYQGILTRFIKPHKLKAWDTRYHWSEDCIFQKQIQLIWK